MTKRIGKLFVIDFGHPGGCSRCSGILYDGTLVAWVDDELTCKDCVDKYMNEDATRRKAAERGRVGA